MSEAKVLDMTAAQLRRQLEREEAAGAEQQQSIAADMADGIEAIHQCMNLADFTERPRQFVFALSTAAKNSGSAHVALYDEELAELLNCSVRTIRRQRAEYLRESHARNFAPVEVVEGEFDLRAQKYMPTLYKFHLADVIEQTVTQARASDTWHESDRRLQREAIRRAAEDVYGMIPDAPIKRRKKRRPRSAAAEIETCQKVILTKLERLKEMAAMLPTGQREQLLDAAEPGDLYRWCEQLRAEIESLQNLNFPQATDGRQLKGDTGQLGRYPPPPDTVEKSETSAAAVATWERIEERLTTPAVQSVEIALAGPESPPGLDADLEEELTLEEERAAIMQYEGGLSRDEADTLARDEIENRRSHYVSHQASRDPE